MKKIVTLSISLMALSVLAACGRCGKKQEPCPQKECVQKECTEQTTKYKRISGPMSDKEVGWTEEDRR